MERSVSQEREGDVFLRREQGAVSLRNWPAKLEFEGRSTLGKRGRGCGGLIIVASEIRAALGDIGGRARGIRAAVPVP